jgi:hypothetical protein
LILRMSFANLFLLLNGRKSYFFLLVRFLFCYFHRSAFSPLIFLYKCLCGVSSRLPDYMIPSDRIEVYFCIRDVSKVEDVATAVDDNTEREATITPYGTFWESVVQEIVEEGYLEDMLI